MLSFFSRLPPSHPQSVVLSGFNEPGSCSAPRSRKNITTILMSSVSVRVQHFCPKGPMAIVLISWTTRPHGSALFIPSQSQAIGTSHLLVPPFYSSKRRTPLVASQSTIAASTRSLGRTARVFAKLPDSWTRRADYYLKRGDRDYTLANPQNLCPIFSQEQLATSLCVTRLYDIALDTAALVDPPILVIDIVALVEDIKAGFVRPCC
jgi:hypothetical protein